jgi:hypothetical protein
MDYHPILNDKLVRRLVQFGSDLDQIEPLLSPPLREALVDLQRNAADAYASGDWTVLATGEKISVPEASSHKENDTSPSLKQQAQHALGGAYLGVSDQGKSVLKTLMQDLGLSPSAPKMQPLTGNSLH